MSKTLKSTLYLGVLIVAFGCSDGSSGGGAPANNPAPAAQNPTANGTVNLEVESVTNNGQVTVPIKMTTTGAPVGLQFNLRFDSSKLRFDRINTGSASTAAGKTATPRVQANGDISVLIVGVNPNVISDGTVAEAVFTTIGNSGETADVKLIGVKASTITEQAISSKNTDGVVTIQ